MPLRLLAVLTTERKRCEVIRNYWGSGSKFLVINQLFKFCFLHENVPTKNPIVSNEYSTQNILEIITSKWNSKYDVSPGL